MHVYGPDSEYPPSPRRSFDAPEASPDDLLRMLRSLGLERAVLVQPSTYGADDRRQIDAALQLPILTRVVAAAPRDLEGRPRGAAYRELVRGLRCTLNGRNEVEALRLLAAHGANHHQHLDLFAPPGDCLPWAAVAETQMDAPVDLVIEHFGSIRPSFGVAQPQFEALLRLLGRGRCWIKLSGAYRTSTQSAPFADFIPFVERLLAERPDRLIWGSDWPHVNFNGDMPYDADLLDDLATWVPSEAQRTAILCTNAATLYGFADVSEPTLGACAREDVSRGTIPLGPLV